MLLYDDISGSGRKTPSGLSLFQPLLLVLAGFALMQFIAPQKPLDEMLALSIPALDADRDGEAMWELVSATPKTLTQLLPSEVQQVFDEPHMSRQDENSGLWQYRSKSCVLNLYFSSEGKGPIAHYNISARRKGGTVSEADCLRSIRDEYTVPKRKKKFA